jgi:methionine-S-sulfoxide reductase
MCQLAEDLADRRYDRPFKQPFILTIELSIDPPVHIFKLSREFHMFNIIIKVGKILLLAFLLHNTAVATNPESSTSNKTAILAGGCFWCIEADFEKLNGVSDVISGYIGGHVKNPTYKQVSRGGTGHIESVRISYDPRVINYSQILDYFWRHIDPTRDDGQFCDSGKQYRPAIFYLNDKQQKDAIASMHKIEKIKPFKQPLKVELIKASEFYPAENYHQDYYKKNPLQYKYYRFSCRRDARVEELWGK